MATKEKKRVKKYSIDSKLTDAITETLSMAEAGRGQLNFDTIPLEKITLDDDNPRELSITIQDVKEGFDINDPQYEVKKREKENLQSLVESIKVHDLLNPIIVYRLNSGFKLVAGERRTLSSILAGKKFVPAKILDQNPGKAKVSILQWMENLERKGLTLWEKVNNLQQIIKHSNIDISPVKLSGLLGCSRSQAQAYASLLNNLNPRLERLIKEGKINNLDRAVVIAKLPENEIEQTIDSLKKENSYQQKNILQKVSSKSKSKKGRKSKMLSLGKTKNVLVAKAFYDSLQLNKKLEDILPMVDQPNWKDPTDINNFFSEVINLLERSY